MKKPADAAHGERLSAGRGISAPWSVDKTDGMAVGPHKHSTRRTGKSGGTAFAGRGAKIAIVMLCFLVAAFCIGSYAIDRNLLNSIYQRYEPQAPSLLLTDADIADTYPYQDVQFQMDGYTLRGHVYQPVGSARGLVVFRHGIFSQHQDYLALITALTDRGWKVFAYDAIGCGESDGNSVRGFAQSPLDVHQAVRFARESGMADGLPVLLMGHSWGGFGVAGALDFGDDVAACVSMSGFDTPEDIIIDSARSSMGDIALTQIPFIRLIGWLDFGVDGNRSAAQAISNAGIPVLVVHGTQDSTVSFDAASIIAERGNISNPNVRYLVRDEEGRNGHNDYFYSRESQDYLQECSDALDALKAEYGDETPPDVLQEFMDGIDKRRANTADPFLIDEIDSFFADAVAGSTPA